MNYTDLDLNTRINLKGTYESFLKIAIEKFQKSQDKKIYNRPKIRFYKKRTGNDRWVNTQSKNLRDSFNGSMSMGGNDTLKIDFLMYGRFVDMGVGRGANMNEALYRKRYGAKKTGVKRTPRRWYSKTKASQEKRLAEILASSYGIGFVRLAESLLNNTVTVG